MRFWSVARPYAIGALGGVFFGAPVMAAHLTMDFSKVVGVAAVVGVGLLGLWALVQLHARGWVVFSTEPREWLF